MESNLDIRTFLEEDRNFLLSSFIRSSTNKRDLPKWAYKRLHDKAESYLERSVIICLEDNPSTIVAYKMGEFIYIKHKYRNRTNEINDLLIIGD